MFAVEHRNNECVMILLANGADVNVTNSVSPLGDGEYLWNSDIYFLSDVPSINGLQIGSTVLHKQAFSVILHSRTRISTMYGY